MSDPNEIRLVLSIRGWDSLREAYRNWDTDSVHRQLNARMRLGLDDLFRVVAYPSNIPIPDAIDISDDELRAFLVFGIVIRGGPTAARTFAIGVKNLGLDAGVGADLVVNPAHDPFWTHWCPNEAGHGLMGDRAWALRTIRADPPALTAAGFPGPEQVNLVFLDTGLPLGLLPADNFKGWSVLEDSTRPGGAVRRPGNPLTYHGEMVARNAQAVALAAAPSARIKLLDCPAIPDGIRRLPVFLHTVAAALFSILATIVTASSRKADGWVICNAWGVFDPTVKPGQVPYSDNPLHPIAIALKLLNLMGADLVFAAGNCGQFCPNPRCSPAFTGPFRSINGANALREVLTVGAVRADKVWLGYSGQGPGIARMAKEKPDICAPSQFASDDYPGHNTGTSAACGLAAGAVALLRTKWQSGTLTTDRLRGAIRRHAEQPYGPVGWQERTGHGILDLAATAEALNQPERSAVRQKRR